MEWQDLVGVPFVDGGRDKAGMDCWGLAKEMFRRQGIDVKDYAVGAMEVAGIAQELKKNEPEWKRIGEPEIGCLVLIRMDGSVWANHVGIYVGDGKFIHAYSKTGVVIDRLKRWHTHIVGFYTPRG